MSLKTLFQKKQTIVLPEPDTSKPITIFSPVNGLQHPLSDVKDEVFSTGMMGPGVAFTPSDNTIYSPVYGVVSMIFPTNHAIGITDINGIEILIHIGMDTVSLKGKHFKNHVNVGDKVEVHTPLITANFDKIKECGYDIITPLIITNTQTGFHVTTVSNKQVTLDHTVLRIEKI